MTTGQRIRLESRKLGREEGRAEGEAKGKAAGKAETLLRMMRRRFGSVSESLTMRVQTASLPDLDRWLDRILDAATASDVFTD